METNQTDSQRPDQNQYQSKPSMFSGPATERGFPLATTLVAGLAVIALVALLTTLGHRRVAAAKGEQPLAAYALSLPVSNVQMSESSSLSGGKETYLDGHIVNTGAAMVTAITVQVLFRNSEGMPPQVETVPLTLIRSREPYIDTEPVSADPLATAAERDFRLTFENIGSNWNQSPPEVHVISVETR